MGENFSDDYDAIEECLQQCWTTRKSVTGFKDWDHYMSQFANACRERDGSTPLADLLKHTGDRMVRFMLRLRNGWRLLAVG